MAKPKILIYGNVYETTVGQGISYMKFFSHFGDVIIVTSEMNLERLIEESDILALPGGMDISSLGYGIAPGFFSRTLNHHYEYLDAKLLKPWLTTGKPVIGICRGMQALNVMLGGTLHRHVVNHVQNENKYDRDDRPHDMYTSFPKHEVYQINSYHHQAVKDLAEGFEVLGWSDVFSGCPSLKKNEIKFRADRYVSAFKKSTSTYVVEANKPMLPEIIRHTKKPYIAFQYHPEEFDCPLAIQLINEVITKYENSKEESISAAITITDQEYRKKNDITGVSGVGIQKP